VRRAAAHPRCLLVEGRQPGEDSWKWPLAGRLQGYRHDIAGLFYAPVV